MKVKTRKSKSIMRSMGIVVSWSIWRRATCTGMRSRITSMISRRWRGRKNRSKWTWSVTLTSGWPRASPCRPITNSAPLSSATSRLSCWIRITMWPCTIWQCAMSDWISWVVHWSGSEGLARSSRVCTLHSLERRYSCSNSASLRKLQISSDQRLKRLKEWRSNSLKLFPSSRNKTCYPTIVTSQPRSKRRSMITTTTYRCACVSYRNSRKQASCIWQTQTSTGTLSASIWSILCLDCFYCLWSRIEEWSLMSWRSLTGTWNATKTSKDRLRGLFTALSTIISNGWLSLRGRQQRSSATDRSLNASKSRM